ncbi:MAG TPA: DUF3000 family protein [Actinocrinis sp.]|jgi:hypothetical protein
MSDPHRGHRPLRTAEPPPLEGQPAVFTGALAGIASAALRPEFDLEALPPPRRLASFSHAVSTSVADEDGDEIASGRFVLLHEPAGHTEWAGVLRCVTLAQADLEPEIAVDQLLPGVTWSWLTESMEQRRARYAALGGTVTRCASCSFGELADRPETTSVELRASWTPLAPATGWTEDAAAAALEAHFSAWLDLLAAAAGLPPLVAGVTMLPGTR